MNFLVKHLVVNAVSQYAIKGATLGIERILAKYYPEYHGQYVETVTEMWDAKIEAFVKRNADLAQDANLEETFNVAKAQVMDLFESIVKTAKDKNEN